MSSEQSNMSSWLGSGLSQITGQISNFTKEVLTEGTEEVDDHATELRVAKGHLVDVQGQFTSARAELDRMKRLNEDLTEKLQASELHTNALSTEYREKLTDKESEMQRLKQQHHALQETQSHLAVAHTTHLTSTVSAPHLHAAFGGDEHDFDDVITGQAEINRLQREVERLGAECRHWRQVATTAQKSGGQQLSSNDGSNFDQNVAELHARIKELEQQLATSIDDHQNELATLQHVHASKLAAQARKQAEEKQRLQEKIEGLEDHILQMGGGAENNVNIEELKSANKQLAAESEAATHKLEEVLREVDSLRSRGSLSAAEESAIEGDASSAWKPDFVSSTPRRPLQAAPAQLELSFSELSENNKQLKDEVRELRQQVSAYQQEISQSELVHSDWEMEKEALESVLVKLRGDLKAKEEQLTVLQAQRGLEEVQRYKEEEGALVEDDQPSSDPPSESQTSDVNSGQPSGVNVDKLSRQMELLTRGNSMLENERDILQEEKEELQQKVSELEEQVSKLFAADARCIRLTNELEEVSTDADQLRRQVNSQDDQLGHLTSNFDESFESIIEKEAEIAELEEKLQVAELENEQFREERGRHLSDEDVDEEILRLREQLREKNERIADLEEKEQQLRYVTVELQERESSFKDLEEVKNHLETSLDELDAQHQDAISAVMSSKEKLSKANEAMKAKMQELEDDLANRSASENFDEETDELREELTHAQKEVLRLTQEIRGKQKAMKDLEEKLEQSGEAGKNLQREKQMLEKQVSYLKDEVNTSESERKRLQDNQKQVQLHYTDMSNELQAEKNKSKMQEGLKQDLVKLKGELDQSLIETSKYTARVEALEKDLVNLQDKLNRSSHELNETRVQMGESEKQWKKEQQQLEKSKDEQLAELRAQKAKLETEVSEAAAQLKDQARRYEDYIKEINRAKELDASSLEGEHKKSLQENHEKDMKISELEVTVDRLRAEVEDVGSQLQTALDDQLENASLVSDKDAEVAALQAQNRTLQEYAEEKVEALKLASSSAQSVTSESSKKEKELQDIIEVLQSDMAAKDLQIESYTEEIERMEQEAEGMKQEALDLKTDVDLAERKKTQVPPTVQEFQSLRMALADREKDLAVAAGRVADLNDELNALRSGGAEESSQKVLKFNEKEVLPETAHATARLAERERELQEIIHVLQSEAASKEADMVEYREEIRNLKMEISGIKSVAEEESERVEPTLLSVQKVQMLQSALSDKEKHHTADLEKSKQEIQQMKSEIDVERKNKEELTGQLESLQLALDAKDKDLSEALDNVLQLNEKISTGHTPNGNEEKRPSVTNLDNKELISDLQDKRILQQKDDVIKELRNNNQSLLKLLEERSLQLHGNKSLVDVHKMQNELKGLRMEKEQIMSVLNDKTRECSNLKSEVHKLMNVVSAEKTALSKLQKDNQELLKAKDSPKKEDPNSDMTREAVKTLSMVIRDKDLEIESLTQKNQTLLQVMQQGSEGGVEMVNIIQEHENLKKQLMNYQAEREQIIVALNQKHQESVAYHAEIQRLMSVTAQNNDKHENLEQEFSTLKKQYEDNKQALLKLQNELLNYKQKFTEVDTKYKEILHRQAQQVQNQVQQPPTPTIPLKSTKGALEERPSTSQGDTPETEADQANVAQYQQHITHLNSFIEQKKEEIQQLNEQVRQLRLGLQERDRAISEHQRNVNVKEQVVKDKETVIEARNQAISEANARVREAHEQLRKKDMDLSSLRKQIDNQTFQARGLQTELNDLRLERDNAMDRLEGVVSERTQLAEANARLSAAIGERDLEMNAMREKTATLTAAVREVGAEKGEVEQMLADTEAMQKAAQVLQAERDQAYGSLQAVQADNTSFKHQAKQLAEREQKLQRELDRLRSHLLAIEEGYTQEALAAEEREKELRNRLAAAEEKVAHSSNAVQNYSVEATRQVESLQEQLTTIAEQRDHAMLQLSAASDTASQYAASLTNLQMVLEQFQKEREEQQSVEMERYQRNLSEAMRELAELREHNTKLQAQLDETTDALEAAQRLSEQLDRNEEAMAALKEEVLLREEELKKAEDEIQRLNSSSEAKVDKLIIKNLILGYFHTPTNKRGEVLTLLGKVLSFSKDEMEQVGADGADGGWLKGMFRRTLGSVATPPTTPNKASAFFSDRSFSEMFVKFLERESCPQPAMRLPAEEMVREQQERRAKPAFNPFTAPAHHSPSHNPAHPGGSHAHDRTADSSHILMKPMTPSMPMFAPVMPAVATPTGPVGGDPGGLSRPPPGRHSAGSSGRSTPASTILKDVLQQ